MLWNLQKTRPQYIVSLQQLSKEEEDEEEEVGQQLDDGQLFNPPLAHSLSVASCGNIFGCGAEDGRIRIFRVTGPKFELELGFKGHSKGVSQVHFLNFLPVPCCLLSGGNDGKVCLWDIGSAVAKEHPNALRYGHRRKTRRSSCSKKDEKPKAEGDSPVDRTRMSPKVTVEHGEKVNWITGAEIKGSKLILVADQSSCISVYPLTGP
ncbi:WD repeat-containing protein 53 isoform X2 [Ambystoma mexicanum]